jgi:peptidoglycan hydrolase CwlO-like protein
MQNPLEQIDFSWLTNTLSAAGAGLATWLFARRKNSAEAQQSELENVEKAVAIWRQIASDLEGKFTALQREVIELRKHVVKLEIENERLNIKNIELQSEIQDLKTRICEP